MSGAHPPATQAGWTPGDTGAAHVKMPSAAAALNTVNLSAVSATLAPGGAPSPAYTSSSSRFSHGSSGHSSPYNISRTASGASDAAPTPDMAAHPSPPVGGAEGPEELTAAALQALDQGKGGGGGSGGGGSGGGGSGGGSRSGGSPRSASTPRPQAGRSAVATSTGSDAPLEALEATLQGLNISGAASPAAPAPLTSHAPAGQPLPLVEAYTQGQGPHGGARPGRGGAPHHRSFGPAAGPGPSSAGGYQPGGPLPIPLGDGSYGAHQPHAYFVGSPPGGYGMPMYHPGPPPPHGGPVPAAPASAGFPAGAYYAQMGGPGGHQGHHLHGGYPAMMHPGYYGMVHPPYAQAPGPYGPLYGPAQHGAGGGGRGGPKGGGAGGYEAEYARQYQAMMSYMQGFGMMVSPSGSPERAHRPGSLAGYRRGGPPDNRGRVGRPSRLSLDMSASKSENGDAHRLDPELAPLVAEDRAELQSELLEQFKADREGGSSRQWTLQELRGHLYPFCRDQHGSRLVQQQLEAADPEQLTELFGEVKHKLLPLMVDVFGNYVVQRFLERGGSEVQQGVADAIRGRALPLSLQMYGCRVVQKALEVLPQEGRVSICQELTEHTLRCVRDQNGNHVVQKCIETVQPSDPARAMIETIVNKGQSLSTHTFGCRLVQRVLQFCSIPELRERVVADVLESVLQLSHDQYGNYVVQHLVAKGPSPARQAIVSKVAPQVMTLAQHKYASNVVEACLKHGAQEHRDAILEQVIREAAARPAALAALMRDQYGNYVVQRCLEVASPQQRAALLRSITPHLETLRKYTYGKHIASKAEALLAAQAAAEQGVSAEPQGGSEAAGMAAPPAPADVQNEQ